MDKRVKWGIGVLAAGAAGVLLDALLLEKLFFQVNTYTIGPDIKGKKLKLALLADLHFKRFLLPQHRRLASVLNRLQPDLLLIAGDILDSTGETKPLQQFLPLLNDSIRIVAIPGNNDYRAGTSIAKLREILERHNGELLVNQTRVYSIRGERVAVTGLDDFIEGESCLHDAVKDLSREENHLLLLHSPEQQEKAMAALEHINQTRPEDDKLQVRYIFAGHNHGGQVRLPGYVPVLPPHSGGYVEGWYNGNEPYLYVSRGFGTSSYPVRFWARAEVTMLHYCV